jgi:DNA polymerase I-like protein with 3'-5' exonuclease and polymerase domains
VHDELLLEVLEADANKAAVLLQHAMVEAFLETFPGAPTEGLVEATIGQSWAEVKG